MKKRLYLLIVVVIFACNSEKANDCFQSSGTIIQQEVAVTTFNKIIVNRGVELILKQGADYKVIVETGKNLINDVEVIVISNRLELTDNNTCNYVRDYGLTKVYVTAPNITEIRCSTQYSIRSQGVLNYESLSLVSEDFNEPNSLPLGDFILELNTTTLKVVSNNLSSFFVSGNVDNLDVFFASGMGRFEGGGLISEKMMIRHRGSNDIIVNPQQELKGKIISTGNLISKNRPPVVDVEVAYIGELIFE